MPRSPIIRIVGNRGLAVMAAAVGEDDGGGEKGGERQR